MSNTQNKKKKPFSGYQNDIDELQAYRKAKQREDDSEAQLDEFCSAIEDFGLNILPHQCSKKQIVCQKKAYTPAEILSCAEAEAQRLEKLTSAANEARGHVLTLILRQSKNLMEYRALRWLYIDSAEAAQRAVDVFPKKQGKLS